MGWGGRRSGSGVTRASVVGATAPEEAVARALSASCMNRGVGPASKFLCGPGFAKFFWGWRLTKSINMKKPHQTSPLVAPPPLPPLSPCVEGGFLARRSDINHDGVLSQKDLDLWSQQYKRRYCHGRGSGAAEGHYRCGATGECVQAAATLPAASSPRTRPRRTRLRRALATPPLPPCAHRIAALAPASTLEAWELDDGCWPVRSQILPPGLALVLALALALALVIVPVAARRPACNR